MIKPPHIATVGERRHPFNSLPGTERLIEQRDLDDEEPAR